MSLIDNLGGGYQEPNPEHNFARRSLISQEGKYNGPSLEYQLFQADNPDLNTQASAAPHSNLQSFEFRDPAFNQESAVGSSLQPRIGIQERMGYIQDEFNDRESAGAGAGRRGRGSLLSDIKLSNYAGPSLPGPGQAAGYTKSPTSNGRRNNQTLNTPALKSGLYQFQNQSLQNAGKMQTLQPRKNVNNQALLKPAPSSIHINPLLGSSEGEQRVKYYRDAYKGYATSTLEGSLDDVRARSRSKSKRAKLERQMAEDNQQKNESMAFLMRKQEQYVNYQQSKEQLQQRHHAGTILHPTYGGDYERAAEGLHRTNSREVLGLRQPQAQAQAPPARDIYRPNLNQMSQQPVDTRSAPGSVTQSDKQQKQNEYKDYLEKQIREQEQKKHDEKVRKLEDDAHNVEEFNAYYKYGRNNGGGSPTRDKQGNIIVNHTPFAALSQQNGGVEGVQITNLRVNQHQQPTFDGNSSFVPVANTDRTSFSPNRQETMHMRPSNFFEDITEDEFNKKEAFKNDYRHQLQQQIDEAKYKKDSEKARRDQEDLEQENKVMDQLDQLKQQYNAEEDAKNGKKQQPKEPSPPRSNQKADSRLGGGPRGGYGDRNSPPSNQKDYPQFGQDGGSIPLSSIEPVVAAAVMSLRQNAGYSPSSYNNNDQLEKLKRMQDDIDRRNAADRFDTQNMIQNIAEQTKNFQLQMRGALSQATDSYLAGGGAALNSLASGFPQANSAFKHESRFEKFNQGAPIGGGARIETYQQNPGNIGYDGKDDMGKLDDLLGGFQGAGQQQQ